MTRLSHTQNALNKIASSPKTTGKISFVVQKTSALNHEVARLLITVPAPHQTMLSETAMAEAVAATFEGVRYLPGSLFRETTPKGTLFGCFVSKRGRSLSMEQASAQGLRQVTSTVFQDDNDDVWTKVGEGATAYLTTSREEDITGLLGAVHSRAIATASVGVSLEEDFTSGDVVYFYDTTREQASLGIAVDGRRVYDVDSETLHEVSAQQAVLVQTNVLPEMARDKVGADKKTLLDYLKVLYGNNTTLFARIKQIVNKELTV